MKRRDLIAGTSVALGAVMIQGWQSKSQASIPSTAMDTTSVPGWLRQVKLTSTQRSAIEKLNQKFAPSLASQKEGVKHAAIELRQLKRSVNISAAEQHAQERQQARALQSYEAVLSAKYYTIGEVLNGSQRQQVRQTLANRRNGGTQIAAVMV